MSLNGTLGSPNQNESKPMDEVLRLAVEGLLVNLHTALPCQVTKVINNSFVNIQPLLMRKYTTGTLVTLPEIQNVQISHLRGADYWIKVPVAVGDFGLAVFCERSIDSWKLEGKLTDPQDSRRHDLSDAVFIPGTYPMNNVLPGAAADMIIHNADADIYLQKAGKFLIKNTSHELLGLLSDLCGAVSDLASATASLASAVAAGFTTIDPLGLAGEIIQATAAGSAASSAGGEADTIEGGIDDLTGAV